MRRSREPGERYPCFNGLRAIAAGSVVVFHVGALTTLFRGSSGRVLTLFSMGVWVFFVISGFLLYRPFAQAHLASRPEPDVRSYAVRRLARIYPAYWVVLAFFTFVVPRATVRGHFAALLHVSLFQNYFGSQFFAGIPVAWSLVAEVSFYIFLPVYALAVVWVGRRWTPVAAEFLGLAVVVAIGFASQAWYLNGKPPAAVTAFPAYLYVFGLGMLLAVVTARPWNVRVPALSRLADHAWISWAVALVFLYVVYSQITTTSAAEPNQSGEYLTYIGRALAAFFIVVPAVFGDQGRGPIRALLRWRPVAYLGLISYGVYLWHPLTLQAIQQDWLGKHTGSGNPFVLFLVSAPIIIAAASVSWYLVERPILRLAHRLPRRAVDRTATRAAALRAAP